MANLELLQGPEPMVDSIMDITITMTTTAYHAPLLIPLFQVAAT